jgi:hypothetical protein
MSYTCRLCEKEFNSSEALAQHYKVLHPTHSAQKDAARNKSVIAWIMIVAGVFIAIWIIISFTGSNKYDEFAQCIDASGAKFYGAFWCSHCADQKNMFGSSSKYLPYVECSTSDKKSELPVCQQAGINSYPTWVFSDGSKGGVLSLEQLSQRTNCPLPA